MADQDKTSIPKKRRGPKPTGWGTPIMLRLQPDLLSWIDAERAKLEPVPSRPEFVRRILEAHRKA